MIRPACAEDMAAMADLFGQLGYPVSPQVLGERWLAPDPAREVLVACLGKRLRACWCGTGSACCTLHQRGA